MSATVGDAAQLRPSYIGARVPRLEDDRFLRGKHRYTADIRIADAVEMVIVRSSFAHARISQIDPSAARSCPGVAAVIAAADLTDVRPIPDYFDFAQPLQVFPLARDKVRYVGAPVVALVADDRYVAEDAAELVHVEYEELPVVITPADALAPDAPKLYESWPDNRALHVPASSPAVDKAFAEAAQVVGGTYVTHRYAAVPMEPRASVARFEDGRLTLWSATQFPHILRSILSEVLPLKERDIRVVSPDLGGGFGAKCQIYPEEFLVSWLSMRLGRPVRFVEDRVEHMVATTHSRDISVELEAAVADDGTIIAIRGNVTQDIGSEEVYPPGYAMAFVTAGSLAGPYRIPLSAVGVTSVVTNKTPLGAYRGFGLPEAALATERLMDNVAEVTGQDPVELRRRMMIRPEDIPYTTATGAVIESGSHLAAFDRVVELGREKLAERVAEHHDDGARLGLGFSSYVEGMVPSYLSSSGRWTAQDSCSIRFDADGSVTVSSGVHSMGQGTSTMIATLTAEVLGIPPEDIRVVTGDTDVTPYGLGAWGSRSTGVFSGALAKAADEVKEKAARIAAHRLEADPADVEFRDGRFHIRGSAERSLGWADVSDAAYARTFNLPAGLDPGLEATAMWEPDIQHWPDENGKINACAAYINESHAAVVRVDLGTGEVRVLDYVVANDCGTLINPMIVEGQVRGGVTQGIGGALYEACTYDDQGQPQFTTFMDYLLPSSTEVPPITVEHFESPSPHLQFGAKGVGESGAAGPAPAIASAVQNALREFGVAEIRATPITPLMVLSLLSPDG